MARMIPRYSVSSQAEIERRAQSLFETAGRPCGRDLDHWLQAEAEFQKQWRFNSCKLHPVNESDRTLRTG